MPVQVAARRQYLQLQCMEAWEAVRPSVSWGQDWILPDAETFPYSFGRLQHDVTVALQRTQEMRVAPGFCDVMIEMVKPV
jgi:hypothetical protein